MKKLFGMEIRDVIIFFIIGVFSIPLAIMFAVVITVKNIIMDINQVSVNKTKIYSGYNNPYKEGDDLYERSNNSDN